MGEDQLILGSQGMELILLCQEGLAGKLGYSLRNLFIKALGGVQSGTNGGAAEGQLLQLRQGQLQQPLILLQTAAPAGDFLGEGNGCGILQMRTA